MWWIASQAKYREEALEQLGFHAFKLDSWHLTIGWLCRLAKNHNVEVRTLGGRRIGASKDISRLFLTARPQMTEPTGLLTCLHLRVADRV